MRARLARALPTAGTRRRFAIAALIAVTALAAGALPLAGVASAQAAGAPGAPSITSVTAGNTTLTPNWTAPTDSGTSAITDYEVRYRPGTSGDWSTGFDHSYDSGLQTGTDVTWSHQQDPLDVGGPTGTMANYVERTAFGSNNGLYKIKRAASAIRIRVEGEADTLTTVRLMYASAKPTDLRFADGTNVIEVTRTDSSSDRDAFSLSGLVRDVPADSWFWLDGYDRTSTNGELALTSTTIADRRLRLDVATVSATQRNATIAALTNGVSYQVQVRAKNGSGWGAWSASTTATPIGAPNVPTGLWLESGASRLIARWSAPANDGGSTITDYGIQYRTDTAGAGWIDWQASTISTATTATITGLTGGTTYQVRVRATNGQGDSAWTTAAIDTAGKPSPPTITLSTIRRPLPPGKSDKGGLLSVRLSAVANGSAVTDYDLRHRRAGTTTWYTYRDRSHDSGRLTTSEASGINDPIDFGTFTSPPGGVAVARESVGTNHGLYKFSKAVDQLWIRARGTITGGGSVVARWHTAKPTTTTLGTDGTRIFSVNTESDHTFWQDGWVVDLPANAYVWLHTTDPETLTERRLQLDFTDNAATGSMVVTGLQNGTTYELQGRATNARGTGAWASASGTAGTPTPPVVNTPAAKSESLDITWAQPASDNGSEIAGYDVRHRAGSSGAWTSWPHTTTARSTTIADLTNNTEYEVQVRARNARGAGFWSTGVKGTPVPQVPDAPAAPTLTSSGTTMTVSWAAPAANGADITDYDVRHCSTNCASDTSWTSLPDATDNTALTATISALTIGTTYQVRVRAENSVGSGEWSAASTHAIGRPSAPAAPTLTTGNARLTATWTAAAGNGSAITDYDVRHCSTNCDVDTSWTSLPDTTPSTALSATIDGLTNGTTYYVQIRAENSAGTGPWSPASSTKAGLPAAPSTPRLVVYNGWLRVDWRTPSGNGSALAGYDVRHCTTDCESGDDNAWTITPVNSTVGDPRLSLLELTNGTTYYIQVRARNAHGSSEWSPRVTATPGTPRAPSAPTLTAGDHKIVVDWSPPGDNGSAISDYDVRHCSSGCGNAGNWTSLPDTTDSTDRQVAIGGLEIGAGYQVQVRAQNSFGAGQWSASSTLTLAASPVPPQGFRICDPSGLTQLWVDYACYIKAGEGGIKEYDTVTIRGSGGDYIEKTEHPSVAMAEVLAYNPQGGFAVVETSLDGVTQDVFAIDVIRFGIRDHRLTRGDQTATLTVWLHSPRHGSPDIYKHNGVDYARSTARLSLPQGLRGATHDGDNPFGDWVRNPTQVAGQYGDSITFNLLVLSAGTYTITIDAYRPGPDASCPTEGPLRCYTPPEPREEISYVTQASATATFQSATVAPAKPSVVALTRADGTVTASWPSVSGATSYHVTYTTNGGASWSLAALHHPAEPGTTSITIDGATNADTYIVGVRARNGAGDSSWRNSPPAGPYTPPPPPAPPGTPSVVTLTRADGTVTASWPSVSGATSYHVTYTTNGGASWSLAALHHPAEPGTTSITIDGATNADTYIVGVRARNGAGDSSWRNSPPAGPYTPPPPAAPTALVATAGDGNVTLNWDDPSNASISGYEFQMRWTGVAWQEWTAIDGSDAATTSHTVDGLTNGTEYRFHVRAVNAAGAGTHAPNFHPWYVAATPREPPA